ncbi:MAG: hypothetical protein ACI8RP_001923 [Urechidicola sp.]|jgi:hypothetical protein
MKSSYLKILIILLLHFPQFAFAQLKDTPELKPTVYFKTNQHLPNNTTSQNKYDKKGRPLLIYLRTDSIIIRKEYYDEGPIKIIAEITQELSVDTTTYYDYVLKKDVIAIIHKLYDIPNGKYTEYYKSYRNQPKIKSIGKTKNSRKIGEWIYINNYSEKTIANYNEWGYIDGKYFEYYFSKTDSTYNVATEGEYELIPNDTLNIDMNNFKSYLTNINSRKKGEWKFYSKKGKLRGTALYDWKD